ncbi:MAG: hypothetical protein DSM106950_10520 [Stigonema ocellatum SAG 48.90 = DSM 106950]|nr:hypothetical protein [Stigonema ocellatum SAG 48.90 = DSM 106950]
MVRTNNKSTKSKTKPADQEVTQEATQVQDQAIDFDVDPELLGSEYNQVRRPVLPYGIVINDNPAGILIPEDQLEKANWLAMPDDDDLTTVTLTEDVTGLLLTKARILVLGFIPEYIRYKSDVPDVGGTVVGLYDEYKLNLDKKTMDVVSEHALVFLDENNRPMHSTPIVIRFKNVALWSFKAARDEFYRLLEKAFSDYFKVPFSGKNDKWRSLGVIDCQFKAIKEGEGSNKSYCCKTVRYTKPTIDNLPQLYLGRLQDKTSIWNLHDTIAGFTEAPALPASEELEVKVLPPAGKPAEKTKTSTSSHNKPPRKISQIEEDDDFEDELEEEELEEDDDFDDDFSDEDDDEA